MDLPSKIDLPFFAYGTLKPGQPGFHLVEDMVEGSPSQATVEGELREQDGLPILVTGDSRVQGYCMDFYDPQEAYNLIKDYENSRNYEWGIKDAEVDGDETLVNVLVAAEPERGRTGKIGKEWTVETDPLFSDALDVVDEVMTEVLEKNEYMEERKDFFRLQMAYLLLWSSIERYNSFRFGLNTRSVHNREDLAETEEFQRGLREEVSSERFGDSIYSADRDKQFTLTAGKTKEAIEYYYQVRSNVVHRGKTSVADYALMRDSLRELYSIFRCHILTAEGAAEIVE